MKAKQIVLRELADRDIRQATAQLLEFSGPEFALRFIDALEFAFRHVGNHPATGLPHFATELDMSGLRTWPVKRFPYLIFYLEGKESIDVWRVLNGKRDVPESLRQE